ncbi:MAG TPA: hypothetical protein PLL64_00315 [Rhodothermales bacterium]|nr:hypothetical protein [Rhodothermales bacterium]HRR08459.1 hypothetical protein [Rhodothermales bacterium]
MKTIVRPIRTFMDELDKMYPFLLPIFSILFWMISVVMVTKLLTGDPRGHVVMMLIGVLCAFYLHLSHEKSRWCHLLFWSYLGISALYTIGLGAYWVSHV